MALKLEIARLDAEAARVKEEVTRAKNEETRQRIASRVVFYSLNGVGDPEEISQEILQSLALFDRPKDKFIAPILKRFASGEKRKLTSDDLRYIRAWD